MSIVDKGTCTQCGIRLIDYDYRWICKPLFLCDKCFIKFVMDHPVITKHIPNSVDTGNDFEFYVWNGLDRFLKDYPLKEGWEWQVSEYYGDSLIMKVCNK